MNGFSVNFSFVLMIFSSLREEVGNHCVKWGKDVTFPCKMTANVSTGVLDACNYRVSIRKVCAGLHGVHNNGLKCSQKPSQLILLNVTRKLFHFLSGLLVVDVNPCFVSDVLMSLLCNFCPPRARSVCGV